MNDHDRLMHEIVWAADHNHDSGAESYRDHHKHFIDEWWEKNQSQREDRQDSKDDSHLFMGNSEFWERYMNSEFREQFMERKMNHHDHDSGADSYRDHRKHFIDDFVDNSEFRERFMVHLKSHRVARKNRYLSELGRLRDQIEQIRSERNFYNKAHSQSHTDENGPDVRLQDMVNRRSKVEDVLQSFKYSDNIDMSLLTFAIQCEWKRGYMTMPETYNLCIAILRILRLMPENAGMLPVVLLQGTLPASATILAKWLCDHSHEFWAAESEEDVWDHLRYICSQFGRSIQENHKTESYFYTRAN